MNERTNVVGSAPEGHLGPRRSLVLAGGGMRVAYQAGVVRAFFEAGLCFDHADGTSGGTINLAMLMSGLDAREMCDRWRTLHAPDFVSLLPLEDYLRGPAVPALGGADGIIERVFPHLGIDVAKINAARGMAGTFNLCNFTTKTNEVIAHDRVTLDHLVAGISLPIFMPGVRIGTDTYTDAVWIKDANVLEAVRRGAEEIWLVWCIGNTPEYVDGPFPQYVHMIEMSANGKLFAELEWVEEINRQIERGERRFGQRTPIRVHVVKPEYPLPLDPDYYFGRIDGASLVALGYADGRAYCASVADGRCAAGSPLSPEATRMKPGRPGVSFRETLEGPFEAAGAGPAARLRLTACVLVQDLERFLDSPEHGGKIAATLDVPGLGENLLCLEGRFLIVSEGDRRSIRYEIPFVHQGSDYLLEGQKEPGDLRGEALARVLTSLPFRLHRGGASGELVGSGALGLGAGGLVATLASLHAIYCHSSLVAGETVAKFGIFLFKDLFEAPSVRRPWWKFWERGPKQGARRGR